MARGTQLSVTSKSEGAWIEMSAGRVASEGLVVG